MPELPEIETIRKSLEDKLCGQMIHRVIVRRPDLRRKIPQNLDAVMTHSRVVSVRRRSKYLLVDLDNGYTTIIHLGMSGRLFFSDLQAPLHKHDHVIIDFDGQSQLRLRDTRRFGLIDVCATSQLSSHPLMTRLGAEPLADEFGASELHELCRHSAAPIKNLLMHAARIVHPTRRAHFLTRSETTRLHTAIRQVLRASIAAGGTTFRDYVDAESRPGLHAAALAVYGRAGRACNQCGTAIRRIIQAGRSTFYCPECQKKS